MGAIMNYAEKIFKFIDTAFPTDAPEWATPNKIVMKTRSFKLRLFNDTAGVPTVILPPQAGHSSHIADYDKGQSIVETVMSARSGPVYCIEWLSSNNSRKFESITDLINQVQRAVSHVGGKAHLIGLCQGGWLAAMYTALNNDNVASLMCIASPIDFHAGGGTIYDTVTKLGMMPYSYFVFANNGLMSGVNMLTGWKMMNAVDRYFTDYLKILSILDDDKELEKTKRFRTWYEHTQDLSGTWYLEAVENLFLKNKLVKKEFRSRGKVVDLANITCPVIGIAGQKDDITPYQQVYALIDHVSSERVMRFIMPETGHVGCFMGRKSQKYIKLAVEFIG